MKSLLLAACALVLAPTAALAQHYGPPNHTAGPPVHGGRQVIHGGSVSGAPIHGAAPRGPTGSPPGFHGGGPGHPRFAAGPIGRLGVRDLSAWRGGYWWHGWRGGRLGWWWFVGGFWYWYNAPVYPYPVYIADYYLAGELPAQGGPMWHYCYNPPGYYPYVRSCAGPWRAVPATPPPPP